MRTLMLSSIQYRRRFTATGTVMLWTLFIVGACCLHTSESTAGENKDAKTSTKDTKPTASVKPDKDGWTPLFNGKNLDGWKSTNFGGEGEVYLEKGNVVITQGVDLSGINSSRKDLPLSNYEIEFEAQRAAGSDFFVGLTFPVKKSSCSLILGGWGGGVLGHGGELYCRAPAADCSRCVAAPFHDRHKPTEREGRRGGKGRTGKEKEGKRRERKRT